MSIGGDQFTVSVDGVGDFTFLRRTIRLNIAISVEQSRLGEGVDLDADLTIFIAAVAALKVLTVEAPKGWDLDKLDTFDEESYDKIISVWGVLRDKENTFRKGPAVVVQADGAPALPEHGVLVPPEVPPGANGP